MAPKSANPTTVDGGVKTTDETTPLLTAPESQTENEDPAPSQANGHHSKPQDDVPKDEMPYTQIFLLCYASLAEPVAYFSIFPFINEMIDVIGHVDEKDVGFWGGLIESLFSLVQMILMIFYGRAADRLGRKPVLVFSLTGVAVATAMFGMSGSLWQMVLTRCLAGVFAGSVVTVRTMISEITNKETQGRAFGYYMFVRNVGIFLGPLIGGPLANPAHQFPSIFNTPFWQAHPYALSASVAGAVVLSSALTSLFFINETLQPRNPSQPTQDPPMSTLQVLKSPGVPIVLYIFGHVMLLSLMYTAVSTVFMYTSVSHGGLAFSDQQIALFIAVAGASQAFWMLAAFPYLQKRFGTGNLLRGCAAGYALFMASYPVMNELLRQGWDLAFWIFAPIALVVGSGVAMAFACIQLCINDIAPSQTVLGTLNALALTVNSGVRAFAPVLGTSIFAAGVKWGAADGHLVWGVLVAMALLEGLACYFLPEAAEGRVKKKKSDDGEE